MKKKYRFSTRSRKHGLELFEYDTLQEVIAAVVSQAENCPKDGIVRTVRVLESMVTYWHEIYYRKWKAE